MIIGIPKETKVQEHRVAMVPATVRELVQHGHRVLVEMAAGEDSSYTAEQYLAAGAEIAMDAASVFGEAELIVKVKEPQLPELELLEPRHTLFTYLHLAASKELTGKLLATGCTATQALNNVTQRWILSIADHGLAGTCHRHPELLGAVNTAAGQLTCEPVGEAHAMDVSDPAEILGH